MNPPPEEAQLSALLGGYHRVIVAFSGGVDSSYLAFWGRKVLGREAVCFTGLSPAVSARQRLLAEEFARRHDLNHFYLRTAELKEDNYRLNSANRCYFCKNELYSLLETRRQQIGADVILDGTNADDLGDFRPGRQAAEEQGVRSPLAELGLSKRMIRKNSRAWGLETWDLPAMPCLSSRFPYGTEITPQRLRQVEKSEEILWKTGFRNFRVRFHESQARLEIAKEEMSRLEDSALMARIEREFLGLGFEEVTVDPQGFRSGSLNEGLES